MCCLKVIDTFRRATSVQWAGDIVAKDNPPNDLWSASLNIDKISRALLSDYYDHLYWRQAFLSTLDKTAGMDGGDWLVQLRSTDPDSFLSRIRGESKRLFSSLSKGIHHEFVVPPATLYDRATVCDLIGDVTRFDVYNDATVLELSRSEELDGFAELFEDVMEARYSVDLAPDKFSGMAPRADVAGLLGRAVLGNMRAFVFACNTLVERSTSGTQIGLAGLTETFLQLATNHYWPLLEELSPKLGVYKPMIEPARKIAEEIFRLCGQKDGRRFALVFRDITEKLAKPFEMLEYSGFVARREVSRAMKSGGRGARFAINLCNLLENVPGTRLTETLFRQWISEKPDPVDFHKGSELMLINLPELDVNNDLEILSQPVSALAKSNAYPYGLTQAKIDVLREAGIHTVAELASATDEELLALKGVGGAFLVRYRNVVGQAIWM